MSDSDNEISNDKIQVRLGNLSCLELSFEIFSFHEDGCGRNYDMHLHSLQYLEKTAENNFLKFVLLKENLKSKEYLKISEGKATCRPH